MGTDPGMGKTDRRGKCRVKKQFFLFTMVVLLFFPRTALSVSGSVNLLTFRVLQENELSNDEPYLWVYGIVIDTDTINNDRFVLSIDSPGHGNITRGNVDQGYAVPIRAGTGRIFNQFNPFLGRFQFGILVVVWEEDYTPNEKVVEAYREVGSILNNFIGEKVRALDFGDPSEEDLAQLTKDIRNRIAEIFQDAFLWYNPLSWDPDDLIGTAFYTVQLNGNDYFRAPIEFDLRGPYGYFKGAYRVKGYLLVNEP